MAFIVGNYMLREVIGRGTYAEVRRAVHRINGMEVAVKIVDKTLRTPDDLRRLSMEIYVQARLMHPNVVQLYEVMETSTLVYMFMELARGGELLHYVNSHGAFKERDAAVLFSQVVDAIEHAHSCGFVNRDIKLDNIYLLGSRLLVGDWGFATTWQRDRVHHSSVGSLKYCSPEIVNGRPYFGPEVDVWSLGVVLYALVLGRLPFNGAGIRSDISTARYPLPTQLSFELRSLIGGMLQADGRLRVSLRDVKYSTWMQRHLTPQPQPALQQHYVTPARGSTHPQYTPAAAPASSTPQQQQAAATPPASIQIAPAAAPPAAVAAKPPPRRAARLQQQQLLRQQRQQQSAAVGAS